ncbi:MAG TPA: dockerin type I domain-containing protein [Clostridia bacterium]
MKYLKTKKVKLFLTVGLILIMQFLMWAGVFALTDSTDIRPTVSGTTQLELATTPTPEPTPVPTPIQTSDGFTIKIGTVSGKIGDMVTVPLIFQNLNIPVYNIRIAISYDSNAVEFLSADPGDIPWTHGGCHFEPNKVWISLDDAVGSNGVLLNLLFKIKSNGSKISLAGTHLYKDMINIYSEITPIHIDGAIICIDTINTPVPVATPTPTPTPIPSRLMGDLNGDGKVNSADLSILKRIILGTYTGDTSYADLNGDRKINLTDYSTLRRIILGIILRT